jgi:uncharacterized protein (DUF58 family)
VAAGAAGSKQRLDSNRDMNDGRSRERQNERTLRAEQYLAPETLGTLAPFELRARMIVEGVMSGMHRSPYQSLAVEFAEHRQYAPGDSIRQIDWKVFARTDKMYVKRYVQETNLDVVVLVDRSSSMRFGTLPVKKGWGGTDAMLVQVLDRQELRFEIDTPALFDGLEGEAAVEADPRAVRSAYLELLRAHVEGVDRIARGFGADAVVCDTHESVGPVIAALLDRRMSFAGRRGG